ncbi:MAG: AMP-binding protein [Oscillospiraceae bacterium]
MRLSSIDAWLRKSTGLGNALTPESLRTWQLERLRLQALWARDKSAFYTDRLAGIDLNAPLDEQKLALIPFTFADELKGNPNRFSCLSQGEISRVFSLFTSGSSGQPKRVFFTEEDLELTTDYFSHGLRTLISAGQTVLVLMPGVAPGSIGDLLRKGAIRFGASAVVCDQWNDDEHAREAIATTRPDCILGIPSQMLRLARQGGVPTPKNVLLSADYAPMAVIQGIQEAWNCKVFTHYGMTEMGFGGAVECEAHAGGHLRAADLLFEVVDPQTGHPLPAGEWGEVVISTLSRRAMPFIRYRTGDCARLLTYPCACGSPFPRLDRVRGRLETLNGPSPSIYALDEVVLRHKEVLDYSVRRLPEGLEFTVETGAPGLLSDELSHEVACAFGLASPPVVHIGAPMRSGVVIKRQIAQEKTDKEG